MGKDLKSEILARIAWHKELIETSEKSMEDSTKLVEQSKRLIRIAMGHDVDEKGNHKTKAAPDSR
jgi:hypothetical protein